MRAFKTMNVGISIGATGSDRCKLVNRRWSMGESRLEYIRED